MAKSVSFTLTTTLKATHRDVKIAIISGVFCPDNSVLSWSRTGKKTGASFGGQKNACLQDRPEPSKTDNCQGSAISTGESDEGPGQVSAMLFFDFNGFDVTIPRHVQTTADN
jgi:hypothetical protein